MADNNFTQLEEEDFDPQHFEDMRLGIQSQLDSTRSIANFFDFLFQQIRSVFSAILGTNNQKEKEK